MGLDRAHFRSVPEPDLLTSRILGLLRNTTKGRPALHYHSTNRYAETPLPRVYYFDLRNRERNGRCRRLKELVHPGVYRQGMPLE